MTRGKYLVTDSDTITNKREIVDTLTTSFLVLNHHQHIIKTNSEGLGTGRRKDAEKYNVAFLKQDLIKSIAEATNPDDIHFLPVPETLARYINLVVTSRLLLNNL